MRLRPTLISLALGSFAAWGALIACSDDEGSRTAATPDASSNDAARDRRPGENEDVVNGDAGADARPDARRDAAARDANGPGEAGTECVFNRECHISLRCGRCDGGICVCEPGPRGTGQSGVDECDDGNDCASSLCVEGPGGAKFYCSDECVDSSECAGMLPVCKTISFLGRICVRDGG